MYEINYQKSVSEHSEEVCAILALPRPPDTWSVADWYWKVVGGTPFLMRNVINLQRAGLNSILVFGEGGGCEELQSKLSRDKRVEISMNWASDTKKLAQSIGSRPTLVLNGGALHSKNEIRSGLKSLTSSSTDNKPSYLLGCDSFHETLSQIACGKEPESIGTGENRNNSFTYLAGGKELRIRETTDFHTQHERLLRESGLSNDSFMDRLVGRFFSRQLTRLFLQTPITPNQITLLSLILGLISAMYFFRGTYESGITGAGLLLLSAWIDCTDGEIARLKFMESETGGKLDILCDNLVHFAVFFTIGMGLYRTTGQDIFKLLGILAVFGSLISFILLSSTTIDQKRKADDDNTARTEKGLADKLANRDFTYFLLLMAVIEQMDIFLGIVTVGANVFAGYLLYSRLRAT